jgi:sulfate/thiosulfate transport system permease protein
VSATAVARAPTAIPIRARRFWSAALVSGTATCYLSVVVLLPLAAVAWHAAGGGVDRFWDAITAPAAIAALRLTVLTSLAVMVVNAFTGTLIAWVLVRDKFRGQSVVNAVIDLPFALPTIVAGLTLLSLYGPRSPIGVSLAYTRAGIGLALLFVTLPFVVRSVQPVLAEVDREAEEAAALLGAQPPTIFRQIILPHLVPAILSGAGLGFARAIGEFGAVVLIAGNIPYQTEVASVKIFGQIEADNSTAAAAISVVLLAISAVLLLMLTRLASRGASREE